MSDQRRQRARSAFLDNCGVAFSSLEALPVDASFRRYFRLGGGATKALLMDAPPPQEDVRPFVAVAQHLRRLGLSAPTVYDSDLEHGFLVLEDFGSDTYTRLLAAGAEECELYQLAADTLIALHNNPLNREIELPSYDVDTLISEARLLVDWYLPHMTSQETSQETRDSYREVWNEVLGNLPAYTDTLVLRDFHVDNLMRLQGHSGVAACGLLDFQDALIGPAAYDVVSLLEDARRDVSPDLVSNLLDKYRVGRGLKEDEYSDFLTLYRVLGAQRHCKVLGIFVRLWRRDGKNAYLEHLPRVARLLRHHLEAPELRPLSRWFEAEMPTMLSGDVGNVPR